MLEQEKHIFDALESIDEYLGEIGISVRSRPLQAAMLYVELFIIEVSHGNKDKPLNEPWFSIIHHHVTDWYEKTYGDSFKDSSNYARGVVLVRNLPIEIQIPYTRTEIEKEGETIWVVFPYDLDAVESPTEWLVKPPSLERLPNTAQHELEENIRKVVSARRQIAQHVGTTERLEGDFSGFIDGIEEDLDSAATSLVKNTQASRQLAIWSLQVALEKTLKTLSIQENGTYKETHDLFTLFDKLTGIESFTERNLLLKFPRHNEVVDARYGHMPAVSLDQSLSYYLVALEIIRGATHMYKRKLGIANGRILIKRPPWLTLPSGSPK